MEEFLPEDVYNMTDKYGKSFRIRLLFKPDCHCLEDKVTAYNKNCKLPTKRSSFFQSFKKKTPDIA